MIRERAYEAIILPANRNFDRFAPSYTPENFIDQQKRFLKPFFSNLDQPIFLSYNLPEEVNAALDSRYSRSTLSKRQLFWNEYVKPVIEPEKQKDWDSLDEKRKQEAYEMRDVFIEIVDQLNAGNSLQEVANLQRARKFFKKWLAEFGDDSIEEMGSGIHSSFEGVSNIVLEEVVNKRIGDSLIVKSSRYVEHDDLTAEGKYKYVVPGEIKGTELEGEYIEVMNDLFNLYSIMKSEYLNYIKTIYPKGEDESETSFEKSRGAKRFDDIRDLLPFSTETSMGIVGNVRAMEDIVTRLLASEVGECRWAGQKLLEQLEDYVPSMIERPRTERGAEVQMYRSNLDIVREQLAEEVSREIVLDVDKPRGWAQLVSSTPDSDIEILSTFLATSTESKLTLVKARSVVSSRTPEQRREMLKQILDERKFNKKEGSRESDRFKKVPRAFENAHYLVEVWGRGGDMRDLHRHRMLTEGHPLYTTIWGYDLEKEVLESPFVDAVKNVLDRASNLYDKLLKISPEAAQYCVPFAYIQRWYWNLTAREIHWIAELRTGPQARPHYKEIVLDIVDSVKEKDPGVFQEIMVDTTDNRLARRESEKKIERRLSNI